MTQESKPQKIMDERITETGCRVRVLAVDPADLYLRGEGVYLDLRMMQDGDGRRAELKMTVEEARWLAESLLGRAGEIA